MKKTYYDYLSDSIIEIDNISEQTIEFMEWIKYYFGSGVDMDLREIESYEAYIKKNPKRERFCAYHVIDENEQRKGINTEARYIVNVFSLEGEERLCKIDKGLLNILNEFCDAVYSQDVPGLEYELPFEDNFIKEFD